MTPLVVALVLGLFEVELTVVPPLVAALVEAFVAPPVLVPPSALLVFDVVFDVAFVEAAVVSAAVVELAGFDAVVPEPVSEPELVPPAPLTGPT